MKRVLMLASVASMIDQFNMPNIALLRKLGYEVDVACNFIEGNTCSDERVAELKQKLQDMHVRCYQIDFARNIKHMGQNMRALRQVEGLMKQNGYAFCHCHSPIGGVVARIAGHRTKTKVIYTAHGFHFYQGAPVMNWLVYYPVEKMLSRWTDVLITINHEDYARAKKKFHAGKTYYLPGIGIDLERFHAGDAQTIQQKRQELGLQPEDVFLLSVGELSDRKNHVVVIEAMKQLVQRHPQLRYFICGQGEKKQELQQLIRKYHLEDHVKLLGFRTDVAELCQAADVFVFPSKQEGLPVALMEAMACGVPVVCSRIRGNDDLVEDGVNGYFVQKNNSREFERIISKIYINIKKESIFDKRKRNKCLLLPKYDKEKIQNDMKLIYNLKDKGK